MTSPKRKEAVEKNVVRVPGKSENDALHEVGLNHKPTRWCAGVPCAASSRQAKMIPLRCIPAGRGLGGPLQTKGELPPRRASLAPTAFSFGGVRNGRIAPAVYLQVCGLTPCGNSSELPLPLVRSANLHGVALLLAGENDSRNLTKGGHTMADSLQRTGRATAPNSGVKTDALPPFNSSAFLQGTPFSEERPLGFVLNALASNDPAAVARLDDYLRGLVDDVADWLKFVAVTLARPADASQKTDAPTAYECRGLGSIVGLLADVLQVVSAADVQRTNAEYRLRR